MEILHRGVGVSMADQVVKNMKTNTNAAFRWKKLFEEPVSDGSGSKREPTSCYLHRGKSSVLKRRDMGLQGFVVEGLF
ncbi:hypothetical protein ACFXTO_014062 [Malus domestica]